MIPEEKVQCIPYTTCKMIPEEHCRMETRFRRCYMVPEVKVQCIPYTTCRMVTENHVRYVTQRRCHMICEEKVQCIPYTTCKMVPEEHCVVEKRRRCHMVSEEKVQCIPYTTCKMISEEHCKMVPSTVYASSSRNVLHLQSVRGRNSGVRADLHSRCRPPPCQPATSCCLAQDRLRAALAAAATGANYGVTEGAPVEDCIKS